MTNISITTGGVSYNLTTHLTRNDSGYFMMYSTGVANASGIFFLNNTFDEVYMAWNVSNNSDVFSYTGKNFVTDNTNFIFSVKNSLMNMTLSPTTSTLNNNFTANGTASISNFAINGSNYFIWDDVLRHIHVTTFHGAEVYNSSTITAYAGCCCGHVSCALATPRSMWVADNDVYIQTSGSPNRIFRVLGGKTIDDEFVIFNTGQAIADFYTGNTTQVVSLTNGPAGHQINITEHANIITSEIRAGGSINQYWCNAFNNITLKNNGTGSINVTLNLPKFRRNATHQECTYQANDVSKIFNHNLTNYCNVTLYSETLAIGDEIVLVDNPAISQVSPPDVPAGLAWLLGGAILLIVAISIKKKSEDYV